MVNPPVIHNLVQIISQWMIAYTTTLYGVPEDTTPHLREQFMALIHRCTIPSFMPCHTLQQHKACLLPTTLTQWHITGHTHMLTHHSHGQEVTCFLELLLTVTRVPPSALPLNLTHSHPSNNQHRHPLYPLLMPTQEKIQRWPSRITRWDSLLDP